jgi:NTE family protein
MKIGLALSGGGARGIAHLGVLKGLSDLGLNPDVISGCSAGAIVGSMYAAGHDLKDILAFLKARKFLTYFRPAFRKGFIKMDDLEKLYLNYFPENSFESLKIPLIINATDLNRGKTVFFSTGELIRPLMGSSCIPVMFEPVIFEGNTYVDGGILNNLPVEPLLERCDLIIGVHTNPFHEAYPLNSMRLVMERSLLLAVHTNVKERIRYCDVFIEPPDLFRFTTLDLDKAQALFDIGYSYVMELQEKLASLVAEKKKQSPLLFKKES